MSGLISDYGEITEHVLQTLTRPPSSIVFLPDSPDDSSRHYFVVGTYTLDELQAGEASESCLQNEASHDEVNEITLDTREIQEEEENLMIQSRSGSLVLMSIFQHQLYVHRQSERASLQMLTWVLGNHIKQSSALLRC